MNDNIGKNLFFVRKKLRLPDFDYSMPGAYFVTICTQNKQCLFGAIKNGKMKLNPNGEIVQSSWIDLPNHYAGINNDVFAVMPNHVHGIIIIHDENRRSGSKPDPTKKHPISEIVRAFKTYSSRNINVLRNTPSSVVWQRGYYEHVIRDEEDFQEIGGYITYNPTKWDNDTENPKLRI
jgi:REP element-mobilizing transposase RayT